MTAGTELGPLLARIRAIYLDPGDVREAPPPPDRPPWAAELEPEAEAELEAVMELLRAVAAGIKRAANIPEPPERTVASTLGGADLVMRWRYLEGRGAEVPELLPGALFLITVLFLDRDEALRRSEEVQRLVAAAGFG